MSGVVPVRKAHGVLHLAKPTGRGYRTACKRTLAGSGLDVPRRRDWSRCWALEAVCARCERARRQCRTGAELAKLAGW